MYFFKSLFNDINFMPWGPPSTGPQTPASRRQRPTRELSYLLRQAGDRTDRTSVHLPGLSVSVSSTVAGLLNGFPLMSVFTLCPSNGCGLGTQPLRIGSPFI